MVNDNNKQDNNWAGDYATRSSGEFVSEATLIARKARMRTMDEFERIKADVANYATAKELWAKAHESEVLKSQRAAEQAITKARQEKYDGFDVTGKMVLVCGLGISGQSAIRGLQGRVSQIVTFDEFVDGADIRSRSDIHPEHFDLIIVSPSFPPDSDFIRTAKQKNVPVFSEIELAWHLRVNSHKTGTPAPWIGVTGTNGKTTVTKMSGEILRAAGYNVAVAGNIGASAVDAVLNPDIDIILLEISSFQLHFTYSVSLDVSVLLNLAQDHIDWHGSYSEYIADKARIYEHTQRICIFNADDREVDHLVQEADVVEGAKAVGFTYRTPSRGQVGAVEKYLVDRAYFEDDSDPLRFLNATEVVNIHEIANLQNPFGIIPNYLIANVAAASAISRAYGVDVKVIENTIKQFKLDPHRNELVAIRALQDETRLLESGKIYYVDDSKGTNTHAAQATIQSYPRKSIVWIGGGLSKGADFNRFIFDIEPYISAAIVVGSSEEPLWSALRTHALNVPAYRIDPFDESQPDKSVMQRALDKANDLVFSGQVVLLSPAAASMDQFENYKDRGNQFADAVNEFLAEKLDFARRTGILDA